MMSASGGSYPHRQSALRRRTELHRELVGKGLVILADTYYSGWHLTIDNMAAPIYRANRLMRAAAVPAGEHTLGLQVRPGILPGRTSRYQAFHRAVGLIPSTENSRRGFATSATRKMIALAWVDSKWSVSQLTSRFLRTFCRRR